MNRKIMCLVSLIVTIFIISQGCTKGIRRDLSSLAIVIGLAIDKGESNNKGFETSGQEKEKILLTAQVVRNDSVGQQKTSEGKHYWNVEVVGGNLLEAIRAATHVTNRSLYLAQNQVVIISSEIAKAGIAEYLDFFFRDHETRYDVSLVISEGNAGEILSVEPHLDNLPAQDLHKLINSQKKDSGVPNCTLFTFIRDYKTKYKSLLVPFVRIIQSNDEKKDPHLFVAGSCIFNNDKMVGLLDEKQTRGLLWVADSISDGVVAVKYNDIAVSLEILNSKGKFKAEYTNGNIVINCNVETDISLGEFQGEGNFDSNMIKELEKLCAEEIKNEIIEGYNVIKEKNADVLGVGEYFYRFKNKKWQSLERNFEKLYADSEIKIDISVHIIRTGSLLKPIDVNNGGNNE